MASAAARCSRWRKQDVQAVDLTLWKYRKLAAVTAVIIVVGVAVVYLRSRRWASARKPAVWQG